MGFDLHPHLVDNSLTLSLSFFCSLSLSDESLRMLFGNFDVRLIFESYQFEP